jgi:N-acetylmuramoyl-L-alanine amidase
MFRSLLTRGFVLAFLFGGEPTYAVETESPDQFAQNLSALGRKPDWSELQKYQATITRDEFVHLLNDVYCPQGYDPNLFQIEAETAKILTETGTENRFVLNFAKSEADRLLVTHSWTAPAALPPATKEAAPLAGFHIALDPGHLGGTWAKMEERWFKIGDAAPVQEGDMTLRVAQLLKSRLQSLGAKVSMLRETTEPITPYRPSDFEEIARRLLERDGITDPRENFDGPGDPEKEHTIAWQREELFYRNSEIRRRASLVNYRLQPDLVLCLHFNAEAWGDPNRPLLVPKNHLHLLVNGGYLPAELELDDQRCEMLEKLLSRAFPEELALAETIAQTMAKKTGLPAYEYKTGNATHVGSTGYVYARNLMATRLYRCPTVYLEPYVMNSRPVFVRVKAGDYEGERLVAGKKKPSIYREYADSVVDGLLAYFKDAK